MCCSDIRTTNLERIAYSVPGRRGPQQRAQTTVIATLLSVPSQVLNSTSALLGLPVNPHDRQSQEHSPTCYTVYVYSIRGGNYAGQNDPNVQLWR